jgi:hypothetical protein
MGAVVGGELTAVVSMRHHMAEHAAAATAGSAPQPGADPIAAEAPAAAAGTSRRRRPPWVPVVPGQHGAWAFLMVPVLCGWAVAGVSPAGWLLLAAWLCAYPVGYYLGRALTARVHRGSWTVRARRERSRALPWLVLTAALGLPLAWARPWLLLVAVLLGAVWGLGLWVAASRGERSLANDLLLVGQATVAVPLSVAVVAGPGAVFGALAAPTWQVTAVVAAYLAGSVLHVKSLLREAGKVTYRRANISGHALLVAGSWFSSPWWLVATVPALLRTVLLRPGMRPAAIGGIETAVALLVVVAAFLAT